METKQLTVVTRVRPLNGSERSKKAFQCVFPLDKKRLLLMDPEKFENNILRHKKQYERKFEFDASFGPSSTQEDLHETTTGPIIDSVINGYNATVFAYGATGSGKTYTMVGSKNQPGLMTLMTKTLYEKLDDKYQVFLSYIEIYNEVIRDLLNPSGADLDLLEDEKGNIKILGLSSVQAPNLLRIMQILQEGNLRRSQEATKANETSSRSHALLQVRIMKNHKFHSKLFMIDLAGSERASNTQNRGIRLKEGAAINRSLLALGNVINSLALKNTKYVNYRDSKLTRLLKDSLGGTAKTCMIAHVTSSSLNFEETYNTLVYASRAMNITNKLTRNRPASADDSHIQTDFKEIDSQIKDISFLATRSMKNLNRSEMEVYPNLTLRNGLFSNGHPTLFTQWKGQYLTLSENQKQTREKLIIINQKAYLIEMSLVSKEAIISAWEKHNQNKTIESIERLEQDAQKMKNQLLELEEDRQKLEKTLKHGEETAKKLVLRLNKLVITPEQKEIVNLMIKMTEIEAQKISALSDLAIQEIIMNRTDSSINKLQKYEQIADKLIKEKLNEEDRRKLEEEYRVVKNQFHYHFLPLKNIQSTLSWNSLLLPKINNDLEDEKVANNLKKKKKAKSVIQFPSISPKKENKLINPTV